MNDRPSHSIHHLSARLTYDAAGEKLTGCIGSTHFNEIAYSGGGRGHKEVTHARAEKYLHNSPTTAFYSRFATTREVYNKKTDTYTQRGGIIPPGHYRCVYLANHHVFHECIFLAPSNDARAIHSPFASMPIVHGRGGFYIHGHGPKGSDGCIVLANEKRRKILNEAIKNCPGLVILGVVHASYMLPAELSGVYV